MACSHLTFPMGCSRAARALRVGTRMALQPLPGDSGAAERDQPQPHPWDAGHSPGSITRHSQPGWGQTGGLPAPLGCSQLPGMPGSKIPRPCCHAKQKFLSCMILGKNDPALMAAHTNPHQPTHKLNLGPVLETGAVPWRGRGCLQEHVPSPEPPSKPRARSVSGHRAGLKRRN